MVACRAVGPPPELKVGGLVPVPLGEEEEPGAADRELVQGHRGAPPVLVGAAHPVGERWSGGEGCRRRIDSGRGYYLMDSYDVVGGECGK